MTEKDKRDIRGSHGGPCEASILRRKKDVQPLLEALQAKPDAQVFYDPIAPWDAFLQHGPIWGVFGMLAMGSVFVGVGIAMEIFKT
jgi:hypothetical protein